MNLGKALDRLGVLAERALLERTARLDQADGVFAIGPIDPGKRGVLDRLRVHDVSGLRHELRKQPTQRDALALAERNPYSRDVSASI
jgi:hypothetical protein